MEYLTASTLVSDHNAAASWRAEVAERYAGRSSSEYFEACAALGKASEALTSALTSPASFQVVLNVIPESGPAYKHFMQVSIADLVNDHNGDLTAYVQASGEVQDEWAFAPITTPDTAQEA